MNKKRAEANSRMYVILLVLLLTMPFVFSGFFDFLETTRNLITGMALSNTTALNITIGNAAPVVDFVTSVPSQSITEGDAVSISFRFNATDTDGASNLDDSTATGRFNKSSETTRTNSSCSQIQESGNTREYNCTVKVWYWDGNGEWSINASIRDVNNAIGTNTTTKFTLGLSTAMKMSPTSLTWISISLTSTNTLSNNDPITVNNTANKDIANGELNVTAINLRGETNTTQYLLAGNFTVSYADACDTGTTMVNGTSTAISGTNITAGNNTAGAGQEDLYFCLEVVSTGIPQQSYSTIAAGAWTIGVD